jgi:excisionase family DNA binding protein
MSSPIGGERARQEGRVVAETQRTAVPLDHENGDRPQPRQKLLTADDVADLLGVTAGWVYEQSRAGRIPTVTLGRYRRYRLESVLAWVEQLEGKGPALGGGAS